MMKTRGAAIALGYCAMALAGLTGGALAALSAFWFEGGLLIVIYSAWIWVLWPLVSALMAYAASKRGIPAILAWFTVPLGQLIGYLLVTELTPSFGAILFSAFIGIVGASAGEVRHKRKADRQ